METEILKEALEIPQSKKVDIAHAIVTTGRFLVIRVANALGMLRSSLYQLIYGRQAGRSARYNKQEDALLLPLIEELCDNRVTNGYRRITAHLNRKLRASDYSFTKVSLKRVYRIMRLSKSLLPKHTGRVGENRAHDDKVVTLHSDTRWCSDGFEISCWNKERERVVFSLDCCDRELMSHVATTGGISVTIPLWQDS